MIATLGVSRRHPSRVLVLALVLVSIAVWAPRTSGPIDLRWDAGAYFTLGTSIAQSHDYRYLNEPGFIQTTQYPPGEALIVAAHQLIVGSSDPVIVGRALRLTYFLLYTANMLAIFVLLRGHVTPPMAAALALVATLSVASVWLSDRAYADLPFALAVNVFLLALDAAPSRAAGATAGAAAVAAFLLRTTGLAVLAAWIVDALIGRRRGSLIVRVAVAAACVGSWGAFIRAVEASDEYRRPAYPYQRAAYNMYNVSYTTNFSLRDPNQPELGSLTLRDWSARIAARALGIPEGLAASVGNSRSDWEAAVADTKAVPSLRYAVPWRIVPVAIALSAALVLAGFVALVRRGHLAIAGLAAIYLAQLCLLPTAFFWPRYLSSIGGVTALALGLALETIGSHITARRWRITIVWVPVAAILLAQALTLVLLFVRHYPRVTHPDWSGQHVNYRLFSYDEGFGTLDTGIDWLQRHAARGDLVVASIPHWVYLRTGLQAIMPPFERDTAKELDLLRATTARFVIVDSSGISFTREYARPALERAPEEWQIVFREGSALEIFERTRR